MDQPIGLLDSEDRNAAANQALLSLGLGLLSSRGPFTQALGNAGSGALDQYRQQLQLARQNKMGDVQYQQALQSFALQKRQMELQNSVLADAIGQPGGQPNPQQTPQQPAAMPAGYPQGAPGASGAPQAAQQPQQGGGSFLGVPRNLIPGVLGFGGPGKLADFIMKNNEPTELMRTMQAAGIDPGSPQGQALLAANIKKTNNIPLQAGRAGAPMFDSEGNIIAMAPKIPDNFVPTIQGGKVVGGSALPGAADVVQANAQAAQLGKAGGTPHIFQQQDGKGGFTPVGGSELNVINGTGPGAPPAPMRNNNPGALMPGGKLAQYPTMEAGLAALDANLKNYAVKGVNTLAGVVSKWAPPTENDTGAYIKDVSTRLGIAPDAKINLSNPAVRQAVSTALMLHENGPGALRDQQPQAGALPALPVGAQAEADATSKHSAENAVSSYNQIHATAQTAPRTIGLLQTISQLADKTMVGPFASKAQFVNGVLNTIGITPGADQAQNFQIMKKNLNMIVGAQRAAAGGGGTDALQSLLEAANPDVSAMNAPALKEAAHELIAYQRMIQAQDRALPNPKETSTLNFQKAQTQMAQLADPRLWQLEHAENDAERTRILSLIPAQERGQILQKAAQARKLGLLN